MAKIKTLAKRKFDDFSIYFYFEKTDDIHITLIDLFIKLGIPEKNLNEIDIVFDDLTNSFFHFFNKFYKISLFVTKEHIHVCIVAKDGFYKEEMIKEVREYFEY